MISKCLRRHPDILTCVCRRRINRIELTHVNAVQIELQAMRRSFFPPLVGTVISGVSRNLKTVVYTTYQLAVGPGFHCIFLPAKKRVIIKPHYSRVNLRQKIFGALVNTYSEYGVAGTAAAAAFQRAFDYFKRLPVSELRLVSKIPEKYMRGIGFGETDDFINVTSLIDQFPTLIVTHFEIIDAESPLLEGSYLYPVQGGRFKKLKFQITDGQR